MPHSVFAPYTSIRTNILFFDNTEPTKETWFYRVDMPEGYKNFSKTKPMKLEHFNEAINWWDNREEIEVDGFPKAKKYSVEEINADLEQKNWVRPQFKRYNNLHLPVIKLSSSELTAHEEMLQIMIKKDKATPIFSTSNPSLKP